MKNYAIGGMWHVALWVKDFEACEHFYGALLGMQVEWRPDKDNVYLTHGTDNLALHRCAHQINESRLDHIGFMLPSLESVDHWYRYLVEQKIKIAATPRTHRDGARSFYCYDPDGNRVQLIYHPPLADQARSGANKNIIPAKRDA